MRYILPLLICAPMAHAQDVQSNFTCQGSDIEWEFLAFDDIATFDYQRISELTLALTTVPEGQNWPRAYTFIGRGDSAIVIVEPLVENSHPVRILTQRGETPLLLVGTCTLD